MKQWAIPVICSVIIHIAGLSSIVYLPRLRHVARDKVYTIDFFRIESVAKGTGRTKDNSQSNAPEINQPENPQGVTLNENAGLKDRTNAAETGENSDISGFNIGDLDEVPRIITLIKPGYPENLRQEKAEASVMLEFLVNYRGNIQEVVIVHPSPFKEFNDASVRALKKWRLSTPRINGRPVSAWFRIEFKFSLEGVE